jgi:hypothetical protein
LLTNHRLLGYRDGDIPSSSNNIILVIPRDYERELCIRGGRGGIEEEDGLEGGVYLNIYKVSIKVKRSRGKVKEGEIPRAIV